MDAFKRRPYLAALSQMGARVSCQTENGAVTSAVLAHLRVESADFTGAGGLWLGWRGKPWLAIHWRSYAASNKRGREMVTEGRWSSATSGGLLFGRQSNCFKSISRIGFQPSSSARPGEFTYPAGVLRAASVVFGKTSAEF